MIPDSFIQDLLARVDIVDVVERYLPLKKGGANYMARCPFHNEKTPSFTVSPAKQFYYCFGCGAKGSAIGFVMEYAGLGFRDAVQDLAGSVGMTVPDDDPSPRARDTGKGAADIYDTLAQAMDFYRGELRNSEAAIAYLKSRGLTGEIAARFQIGYAPDGWQGLAKAFPDYQSKRLVDSGLVIEGEGGKRYDRFRDRIMFPIINQKGQVIGFGGRVMGAGEPKYLNSPETPVFEKGRELYGLPQARLAIRETGAVVVVEGYMDVVALAQHGVANAVAALGTATTPTHVQKLVKQANRIVFCFDGDDAGRKAAWRALENSLAQLADDRLLSFVFLPQGEDPDSFVRKNGRDKFDELQRRAMPLSQFLLDKISEGLNLASPEGRSQLLHAAKPLVLQIAAPALKLQMVKRLAELASVSQPEVEHLYEIRAQAQRAQAPARGRRDAVRSPAHGLLQLIALNPALAPRLAIDLFDAATPEGEAAHALVGWVGKAGGRAPTPAMLFEHFRGSPVEPLIAVGRAGAVYEKFDEDAMAHDFDALQKALRADRCLIELRVLEARQRNAALTDEEGMKFMQLRRQLEELKRSQTDSN